MDDASPTGPANTSNDFRRESDPASAETTNARNDAFGDQPNWMPIDSQLSSEQRNLQGLAIGDMASISITTANYRNHEINTGSGYGNRN